jgi:hypothetical protein
MTKRLLFFLSVFLTSIYASAQPGTTSIPIGFIPTQYNGGFAGEAGVPRLAASAYLTDWWTNNYPNPNYGMELSYDNFFRKIRSGVALTVRNSTSQTSYSKFSLNNVSLVIAPKISFGGKYTFSPFARFNLVDWNSKFATGDMNNPDFRTQRGLSGNASSGFLLNSSNAYVGVTVGTLVHHFYPKPTFAFPTGSQPKVQWAWQAGYTYQRTPDSNFSVTAQVAMSLHRSNYARTVTSGTTTYTDIVQQNTVRVNDLSLMFRYKKWLAGVNEQGENLDKNFFKAWKDPDFTIGYQKKNFRVLVNQNYSKYRYVAKVGIRYTLKSRNNNGPVGFQARK